MKALLIDNFDSFTFNLVDFLRLLDVEVKTYRNIINPEKIDQIKPDFLVFSPGPSVPNNAGNLLKIIDQYYEKYPMFGVCLGHEALIEAFGGSLKFVPPVHGKKSSIHHDKKTIFKNIKQDFQAGRYHSLVGDNIPDCFEVSSKVDDLAMSMRHKNLPIESVQFHPESVLTMENNNGLKLMKNFIETYF
jgi:para-aminobenzoate synthetase component 2